MSTQAQVLPPAEQEFSTQGLTIVSQMRAITVVDQDTYDLAAAALKERAAWKTKVVEFFKPMKEAAHAAHKAICDREKDVLKVGEEEDAATRKSLLTWDTEQESLRLQQENEAIAAAKKVEEEQRIAQAQNAEALGAPKEAVQQILDMPSSRPAPSVAPTYSKAAGVGASKRWTWRPVGAIDRERATPAQMNAALLAVVKAAAKNPKLLLGFVQLNEKALTSAADGQKSLASVPGINFYEKPTLRVGSK